MHKSCIHVSKPSPSHLWWPWRRWSPSGRKSTLIHEIRSKIVWRIILWHSQALKINVLISCWHLFVNFWYLSKKRSNINISRTNRCRILRWLHVWPFWCVIPIFCHLYFSCFFFGFVVLSFFFPTTFMLRVSFSPAPECVIVVLVESTFSDPRSAQNDCYCCCRYTLVAKRVLFYFAFSWSQNVFVLVSQPGGARKLSQASFSKKKKVIGAWRSKFALTSNYWSQNVFFFISHFLGRKTCLFGFSFSPEPDFRYTNDIFGRKSNWKCFTFSWSQT